MNKHMISILASFRLSLALVVSLVLLAGAQAGEQCPLTELTSGLRFPLGITQSNQDNLIVSETGSRAPNTGRISVVDLNGNRQTLLDGLPSGINDVNEPSGPAGVFMRGRTLYVAIGIGDSLLAGPVPNPNRSSPIFSSVLAIHFSAHVEKTTAGFTLTTADHQALAGGERVRLSNGGGDRITVDLIANFPDSTPDPTSPSGLRNTNPFDLVVVGDQVYVTDGGQNLVWRADIPTGAFTVLTNFPRIANPLFPTLGGPLTDAVPTGIAYSDGQLLVTLFGGFPFPAGVSVVERVDPETGTHTPFITGLKTAIDVLPIREGTDTEYLVLQHTSGVGPPFLPPFLRPGLLLRFETPGGPPTVIADCLTRPTSMTLDEKTGTLYVTEIGVGRVVSVPIVP